MTSSTHAEAVLRLPDNPLGRDFCVGDIHGMFDLLDALLEKTGFDHQYDRLFSVGDLVDRGPQSMRSVEFLQQPWFFAIRGNHEDMLINAVEDPDDQNLARMWQQNGGDWWQETVDTDRQAIYTAVKPLPLAIEIDSVLGPIGVVHADIPPGMTWSAFLQALEQGDDLAVQTALWSRTRAKMHRIAGEVEGVERVYCGHNIVNEPLLAGNVRYIDTGAYLPEQGQLTMVEISHPDETSHSITHDTASK